MMGFLRYLAALASLLLAVAAVSTLTTHEPREYNLIAFLGFAIASVALFGWSQAGLRPYGFSSMDLLHIFNRFICLFGHVWNGCKCVRCYAVRDESHSWDGCRCTRCAKWRGENHLWRIHKCTQICERCHMTGETVHTWDGCRCKVCEKTQHEWQQGLCTRCGIPCQHPEVTCEWKVIETATTVHAVKIRICKACQTQLSVLCQTAPQMILVFDPTQEVCIPLPSLDDLANNPLWLDLKNYWQVLHVKNQEPGDPYQWNAWRRSKSPPVIILGHEEVLKTLVKLKQLDSEVAEGVRRAFNEAYYFMSHERYICYDYQDLENVYRADLAFKLTALGETDECRELQMKTVERIQASIAQDIGLLSQAFATEFPQWQNKTISADCNAKEAARVIVALLLNSRNPS